LALVGLVASATNVCKLCSDDTYVEFVEWSAVKSGDTAILTASGELGFDAYTAPYPHHAGLRHWTGSDEVFGDDYDVSWDYDPPAFCLGGLREYQAFTLTITVPLVLDGQPDTFRVSVHIPEGEGHSYQADSTEEMVVNE
jgi:hypothetical protein